MTLICNLFMERPSYLQISRKCWGTPQTSSALKKTKELHRTKQTNKANAATETFQQASESPASLSLRHN